MSALNSWLVYFVYINISVILAIWLSSLSLGQAKSSYEGNVTHVFEPAEHKLGNIFEGNEKIIVVTLPFCELNFTKFTATIDNEEVSIISNKTHFLPNENENNTCHNVAIAVTGKRLGESILHFKTTYTNLDPNDPCSKEIDIEDDYKLVVARKPLLENIIFTYGTAAFLVVLNFGFGCSLNLGVVKEILKKPIAPGVGFCCQYIMMPLIGLAVAFTLLRDDPLFAFGLICSSCSPGGAGSNVWCLLLGGDVSLSLTMTFFSLSASLGMMPLWLFLLGRFFIDTSTIKIPYVDILSNLTLFVGPCFVGIIIRKFKKPIAERLGKMIKPLALLFLAFLLTFGLYTNRYVYAQIGNHPYIIPPAILQPYIGFGIGFLIARHIARQPKYRCITIAIETGVQNVTIPMVLLQGSFKQPYGDLAAVMPVVTAHFTPLPMIFAFIALTIYKEVYLKKCKKIDPDAIEEKEAEEEIKKDPVTNLNGSVIDLDYRADYLNQKKSSQEIDNLLNGYSTLEIKKNIMALDRESVI